MDLRPDKPRMSRIVWRYKINMLLLVHENYLFAYGACIWNFTWGNEAWYSCPWRNIRFITRISLVSSIQSLGWIANIHVTMPCCVTAYVFVKLSRNQSWVNLLFSVLRDLILDSILDSLFSILNSRFAQESRIANRESWIKSRIETCNGLSTYFWTVLYMYISFDREYYTLYLLLFIILFKRIYMLYTCILKVKCCIATYTL